MQIAHADELVYDEAPLPHRSGRIAFKYLLEGEEATADNFSLVLSREGASFFSPRHRHPWDQIRYCIEGSVPIGPRLTIDAGEVGYFPEGVHYGPQEGDRDRLVLVLQFGGASGQGYLSRAEVKAGHAALAREGRFESGVYRRAGAADGRRNLDGYEAIWRQVTGRPVVWPAPRFKAPVVMRPENFSWKKAAADGSVRRKPLGSFSERSAALELVAVDAGASHAFAPSPDRRLVFVVEGAGADYRRHTALRLDSGESFAVRAEDPTELLTIVLPEVEARM